MKDFLGNELKVGDKVIFIEKRGRASQLNFGEVAEIKSGIAYMKIKYSDTGEVDIFPWGSRGQSIYKLASSEISDNTKKT